MSFFQEFATCVMRSWKSLLSILISDIVIDTETVDVGRRLLVKVAGCLQPER
jgi:hypothetical protein